MSACWKVDDPLLLVERLPEPFLRGRRSATPPIYIPHTIPEAPQPLHLSLRVIIIHVFTRRTGGISVALA